MIQKTIFLAITLFILSACAVSRVDTGHIGVHIVNLTGSGGQMTVSMDISLDSLQLGSNRQLFVTPYLEGANHQTALLPTLLINGRNMQYVYERSGLTEKARETYNNINKVVKRQNGTRQSIDYLASVGIEPWMRREEVSLRLSVDSCGCGMMVGNGLSDALATMNMNPGALMRLVYVTPPVTEQPVVAHEGMARVQFEVDSITLHTSPYTCRNGQRIDNRAQLRIIDDSVSYALSDPNVEIAAISVCGYASPESPYIHNDYLATGRSRALSLYLSQRYNLPAERCTYNAVPENWEEFRQIVVDAQELSATQREALLQLIDRPVYGPSDYDAKELELKSSKLFSRLYREKILPVWFPQLRCTKFVINTRLRPMPDEKLAQIILSTPQLLSLNQMFRVARLYPEGSEAFNKTIGIALRYYADDPVANTNAAITAIKEGRLDDADSLLLKAGNLPEAENARGVLATLRGDYESALLHFAAASLLPEAQKNKEMLE